MTSTLTRNVKESEMAVSPDRDMPLVRLDELLSKTGATFPWNDAFLLIREAFGCAGALAASAMPRGTIQITQLSGLDSRFVPQYRENCHLEDSLAWGAISSREPICESDCWPTTEAFQSSGYFRQMLEPRGIAHVAAVCISDLVLGGYPSAIEVFRTDMATPFTADDLAKLELVGKKLNQGIRAMHAARREAAGGTKSVCDDSPGLERQNDRSVRNLVPGARRQLKRRFFAVDSAGQMIISNREYELLDDQLRRQLSEFARKSADGETVVGDRRKAKLTQGERIALPDSNGDLWIFRAAVLRQLPALGDGEYIVFCLQPECEDWQLLRAEDFAGDQELARLTPAIKFLHENFHRMPTLDEIADTVSLSPFHFHRTFTELMGITPKHLLLDCQIERAKHELLARKCSLVEIAKACGFAHQSHFTSRFKQATGLTPTRWRKFAYAASEAATSTS